MRSGRWEQQTEEKREREKMKKKKPNIAEHRVVRDLLCVKKDIYKIIFRYFFFFFLSSFLIGSNLCSVSWISLPSASCLLPQLFWVRVMRESEWERNTVGISKATREEWEIRIPLSIYPNTRKEKYMSLVFMLVFSVYSLVSRSPARFLSSLPVFIIIYLYYYIYCTNTIRSLFASFLSTFFSAFWNMVLGFWEEEETRLTNTMKHPIGAPMRQRQASRRMRH